MNRKAFAFIRPLARFISLFSLTALLSCPARAGNYYLQANQPQGSNWNTLSAWWSQPSGGGGHPTSLTGHQFFSNGFVLRTPESATPGTFGGSSLTLSGIPDANNALGLKTTSGGTVTIPSLTSNGSEINQSATGTSTLVVNSFSNFINTTIDTDQSNRSIILSIGTLTGTGDLAVKGGGTVKLGITNASGFTGDILWANSVATTLEFTTNITSGGRLVVPNNGRIILTKSLTFKNATINGTTLAAGTYNFAYLNTNFPSQFVDGGTGSIVVQAALAGPDFDPVAAGYTPSFSDEFSAAQINVSNWGHGTQWIAHKPDGQGVGYGVFTYGLPEPNPYSTLGGILSIKAWFMSPDSPEPRWHAGILSSVARGGYGFAQRYGYFETRMKFPNKSYAWPAFWLLSAGNFDSPVRPVAEIDHVEFYGSNLTRTHSVLHRWQAGTDLLGTVDRQATFPNLTTGFHTYGILVKPESITCYIDGIKYWQQPSFPETREPLFPVINYALSSTPPHPTVENPEIVADPPSYTQVDYVRVYEAPPSVTGLLPRASYAGASATSQDGTNTPAKAIDGGYFTHWLSAPGVGKPHQIVIDLGSPKTVSGLTYLPRQTIESLAGLIQNYEIRVSADNSNWTLVKSGTWSNSPLEKIATFAAQTNVRYVALKDVGTNGTLTAAAEINIFGTGGVSLISQDINAPTIPGTTSESGGVYTIRASGNDISGNIDQFRFVYRQMTGNCKITAKVTSLTKTNDWAKAGVMMRETLQNNSKNAATLMTGHSECRFQSRLTTNGTTASVGGPSGDARWVRLERTGDTFTGYSSTDGITWAQTGTATIPMAQTIHVGFAVTSHTNAVLTTAVLDNLSW